MRDLNRKIEGLEETIADYEGTITQFRELVGHLQRYAQIISPASEV